MPGGDGTGPMGSGAGTGWGRGGCIPFGIGRRSGAGRGFGFRNFMPWNWGAESSNPKNELSYLENLQTSISEQIKKLKDAIK